MPLFFKKLFRELLIILAVVYLLLITIGITYSDNLIFLPQPSTYSWSDKLITIQSESIPASDGKHIIVARYLKNPAANYTILYSHGNASDLGRLQHVQENFYRHGYSIIMYDYSGYGLSEGEASEQQVYNDVKAVYSYLVEQENLSPAQIISYGHSLGTAVATDLAFKNPVAALVLESPFTTAFRVKTVYPLLPFDKFSSIDKINRVNTPVFITHSRDDAIVPFWHGEELFDKAKTPKDFLWLDHAGHTKITHKPSFWLKLNAFLNRLTTTVNNAPGNNYLPMQKSENILPSKSSLLNSPVIDDRAS